VLAWRIYLGLPLCGSRLPDGGQDELMRRVHADAVRHVYGPLTAQAVDEFPSAYAHLRDRFGLAQAPAALVGGSAGGAVAARVAVECTTGLEALVLINALVQVRPGVDAMARRAGTPYLWSPESEAIADRLDFPARGREIAALGQPAVLLVVGEDDLVDGFRRPAQRLHATLSELYDDPARTRLEMVAGMGHAFAEEPGTEPAPPTRAAAVVDRHVTGWLREHLSHGERIAGTIPGR
jgi:pimeloyl-ACP methyl ester carboxylesterase